VGDKWSVQVVGLLGNGERRFTELRDGIEGISQRMLALTLKGLERDGLITRTVYPTIPPARRIRIDDVRPRLAEAHYRADGLGE
jgi:DNA-binding HxlR family transcriptional regulator